MQVYVNENHFADFNHRLDFADATHLHILGDVDIAELEFLEPVVSTSLRIKQNMYTDHYTLN